jgi:hypothetical protein
VAWFFSRRPQRQKRRAGRPYSDSHRSPGLALLFELLDRRPARAILDLGPSSTESLNFLSGQCQSLVIQDAFHSSAKSGQRSEVFCFESAASVSLPPTVAEGGEPFDVVLLWDLLHYLPKEERKAFVRRVEKRLAANALALLVTATVAPIPPSPIHFKVLARERVDYHFDDDLLLPGHGLPTREVETTLASFEPLRLFQLRNGYQEVLFRWQGQPEEPAPEPEPEPELEPAPEPAPQVDAGPSDEPAPEDGEARRSDSGRHLIVFAPEDEVGEEPEEPEEPEEAPEEKPPEEESPEEAPEPEEPQSSKKKGSRRSRRRRQRR